MTHHYLETRYLPTVTDAILEQRKRELNMKGTVCEKTSPPNGLNAPGDGTTTGGHSGWNGVKATGELNGKSSNRCPTGQPNASPMSW